jgi:hypothetical protein
LRNHMYEISSVLIRCANMAYDYMTFIKQVRMMVGYLPNHS